MSDLRQVFYVSDGTGITAETIGHSLLTQFAGMRFQTDRLSFVDDEEKARDAADRIRRAGEKLGNRPIVINSCVDPSLSALIAESGALMLDVFAPFIEPLERELGQQRQSRVGQAHGLVDFETYHRRINAMNFALTHDDGMAVNYDEADVILVAVSRAGKTPTCVYLALHYGIRAANYPLTDGDLETDRLPPARSSPMSWPARVRSCPSRRTRKIPAGPSAKSSRRSRSISSVSVFVGLKKVAQPRMVLSNSVAE